MDVMTRSSERVVSDMGGFEQIREVLQSNVRLGGGLQNLLVFPKLRLLKPNIRSCMHKNALGCNANQMMKQS